MLFNRHLEVWERNLYIILIAQTFVMMGFSIVFPFMPLFVQELGIEDYGQASFWSGLLGAGMGLGMFLSGPFWGVLADRFGRKPMLLRAQIGGAVALSLSGLATNVYQLLALRILQGLISGSLTAAMALVSSQSPREKMGYSLGLLQMAAFIGNTVGPLVGGLVADAVGFRATFIITGLINLTGAVIVLFFVKEDFKPQPRQATQRRGLGLSDNLAALLHSREVMSVIFVLFLVQAVPGLAGPIMPLFFKSLAGGQLAASAVGVAFALMGILGGVGALIAGHLSLRVSLKALLVVSCLGAGVLYVPMLVVPTVALSILILGVAGSFKGGMVTAANALMGITIPKERHGAGYGLVQSTNAVAFGVAPLVGGAIGAWLGFRAVFAVNALALVLTGLAMMWLIGGTRATERKLAQEAINP